ncbi:MAG TPA: GNAT family N-acetyltransferase [Pseudomonadales bacterium]
MNIEYKVNAAISVQQFIELLRASTLAERRPVDNPDCLAGMLANSNLMVSAWHDNILVGIARSMTDFSYACYLSDLAVHAHNQNRGIGRQLQLITRRQLDATCSLILVAAPAANGYYEHLGFTHNPRCWVLAPGQTLVGEQRSED